MTSSRSVRVLTLALALMLAGGTSDARAAMIELAVLEISGVPGATLRWDGHLVGQLDDTGTAIIANIPLGVYTITVEHQGFDTAERQVDIRSGEQSLHLSMREIAPLESTPVGTAATFGPGVPDESDGTSAVGMELPDPFAHQSTPWLSVTLLAFLVAIAGGALWLGRRHRAEPEEERSLRPEGPRVVLATDTLGGRRTPGFYEDLRDRETVLEGMEGGRAQRPRPKIIDLPAVDHRPEEEDR